MKASRRSINKRGGRIMKAEITLTVIGSKSGGKKYTFADRKAYVIGRGTDCDLQMPSMDGFQTVSRRHCMLRVDPPTICLRDLGSRNGTVLNGEQIGCPEYWRLSKEPVGGPFTEHELNDGDEFTVGGTVFKIHVSERPEEVPEPAMHVKQGNEVCANS
jgi:eukaryotic-like serine/threonine-protein kinase